MKDKICQYCHKNEIKQANTPCSKCNSYGFCEVCGIIFRDREKVGKRCLSCADYEQHIKDYCAVCEKDIPGTKSYFKVNGNFCSKCIKKAMGNLRFAK